VFGPSKAAAQIEGSKAFAKDVMAAAGVPTARHWVCDSADDLAAALDAVSPPYVVKHDELAAGKGVIVTPDRAAAEAHAAGHRVVVEEYLDGPEVSLFCVTDGSTVVPLAPAQDFKRVGDDDAGPNTGGMGAYAPLPWAPSTLVDEVVKTIVQPVVDEMASRGATFSGLLYAGLALTSRGPMVIEFNARFGDPETQAIMPRLAVALGPLLLAAARASLADARRAYGAVVPALPNAAVAIVLAASGYPGRPRVGDRIRGLEETRATGSLVFHSGTARQPDGQYTTRGGRVLTVVGRGEDLDDARAAADGAANLIEWAGMQRRHDIATHLAAGVAS
jgi:phosphoribosylamine--glycine ligase